MIDTIAAPALRVIPRAVNKTATKPEAKKMDLNELKVTHPEAYAAARAEGVTEERDRVEAHLTMGTSSGDMKTALEAIESGEGMTAKLQAKYMSAGMNRADMNARETRPDWGES